MAAYVVVTIDWTDQAGLEEYRRKVGAAINTYGGRFLAAAIPDFVEGDQRAQVGVILEFPTMERARAWYNAPDYEDLKALRLRSSRGSLFFLDGLPGR